MANTCICFLLLVMFIQQNNGTKCIVKTESGETSSACCADFEEKDGDCIACSKGYTSHAGKNCKPCQNNTYGERCRHDCYCSVFEICDFVNGCVQIQTKAGITAYKTSKYRTPKLAMPTTSFYEDGIYSAHTMHSSDTTTLQKDLYDSTNENTPDSSSNGMISTEMILNITLSVIVGVFGVCLCFIYFKYKSAAKRRKPTLIQSPLPLSPQNEHSVDTDYRLYDIINEADMLDDHHLHRMQISSDYLDVISASSSTGSFKSTNLVNLDFPGLFVPYAKTKTLESTVDCSSLISDDSTLSSDAGKLNFTQDYLNPYTAVIQISPPIKNEYLKLQTVHKTDTNSHENKSEATNEIVLQYPLQPDVDVLRQLYEPVNPNLSVEIPDGASS